MFQRFFFRGRGRDEVAQGVGVDRGGGAGDAVDQGHAGHGVGDGTADVFLEALDEEVVAGDEQDDEDEDGAEAGLDAVTEGEIFHGEMRG